MATGQTDDDRLTDYDLFMAVLEDLDKDFAVWLDEKTESVTVHGFDGLIQFIMQEEDAKRLLTDTRCLKMVEAALAAIMPATEIHITWPVEAKDGKI